MCHTLFFGPIFPSFWENSRDPSYSAYFSIFKERIRHFLFGLCFLFLKRRVQSLLIHPIYPIFWQRSDALTLLIRLYFFFVKEKSPEIYFRPIFKTGAQTLLICSIVPSFFERCATPLFSPYCLFRGAQTFLIYHFFPYFWQRSPDPFLFGLFSLLLRIVAQTVLIHPVFFNREKPKPFLI
jgi:hypothetical protein